MASVMIASSSVTQTEPKRPLMPNNLLKAAIDGNETDLKQLLGLNDEEQDYPPHTKVPIEDVTPMEPSDRLIRSAAGMENTILHILSANGHKNLVSTICLKDSSLLKARNARNETPFHHAARFGHENVILKLIEHAKLVFGEAGLKELLRQKNCLGETTLLEAARHGHGAVVSTLMEEDMELAGLVNDDSVSPLYLATARGSLDMVHNMVAKMSNHEITPAFYSGPKKQTALHAAVLQVQGPASTENHKIAELLLDKDPSLAYIEDSDGSFPVHTAVRMGHVKMIVLLLQRCLDSSELLDGNGRNFLHIAIEENKLDVIFKLLKDSKNNLPISHWNKMFGRMANTTDNKGNTPLHLAAEHEYVTVLHSLLENNDELDLTLQKKVGQTSFDLSATVQPSDHRVMSKKLLKAAIDGNKQVLKEFLGLKDDEGDHPPHTTVSVEDVTPMEPSDCLRRATVVILKKFLGLNNDEEAFVEDATPMEPSDRLRSITTGMGNTILHVLSANGHKHLVATICMKDSSLLKARNVRNETPFHHAARFGHIDTIVKLIEHAKSKFSEDELKELLRQKNCLEETALHEAARHGHGAVVSTLMEEDLELAGMVNYDFVSPLYLATARGSLPMVQKMVEKLSSHQITPDFYSGPKKQTAMHAAVLLDTELTKEVLRLYSEPLGKGTDETRRTPLHLVASTGNHNIAKLLLDKDPSLAYIKDSDGSFPVHTAVRMGHVKMIVLLLQRCPDSGDLLDRNGRNFLHIAIEVNKSDVIFKLLKDSKNNLPISHWKNMFNSMLNTMDNKGNTPLHLAAEHGHVPVMISLLRSNIKLDLTLQNKEGLTAADIAVIRLTKSATNTTENRDMLDEFYIKKRGDRFSTGWFQYYTKDQMSKTELIGGTNQDHISTMDKREAKKSSDILMAKAQLVGLGSVLIATVAFAAAFTLPGGTNPNTGTPILGGKYLFKAFVLADSFAFALSFASTMFLIYSSSANNSGRMERKVATSITMFTISARCMGIALGLGLYLVLAPIGNIGAVILSCALYLTLCLSNPFSTVPKSVHWSLILDITKHIPDAASGSKTKYSIGQLFQICAPVLAPFIFIFLFALI